MVAKQPLISVIVPVYKVELYIKRCVESLLQQTLKDFECILVNDGTPDQSIEVIQPLICNDSRFQVVHQENKGLGEARNAGLEEATGAYLCFVDSDDYLEKDFLEVLYAECLKNEADMCFCNLNWVYANAIRERSLNTDAKNWKDATESILKHDDTGMACGVLFKSYLFEKVRFPRGLFEDGPAVLEVFVKGKPQRICYTEKPLYNYRQNEGSITKTYTLHHLEGFLNLLKSYENILKAHHLYETYEKAYERCCVRLIVWFGCCIMAHSKEPERYIQQLKQKINPDIFNFSNLFSSSFRALSAEIKKKRAPILREADRLLKGSLLFFSGRVGLSIFMLFRIIKRQFDKRDIYATQ